MESGRGGVPGETRAPAGSRTGSTSPSTTSRRSATRSGCVITTPAAGSNANVLPARSSGTADTVPAVPLTRGGAMTATAETVERRVDSSGGVQIAVYEEGNPDG